MKQTPINEIHNDEVLKLLPSKSRKIIEIGCSSGALAREFKKVNPNAHWIGVEIDPNYAEKAKVHCDEVIVANLEDCDRDFFDTNDDCDCWVFADVLEHFKDPWAVLKKIRRVLPSHGCVVASIPNAQNWQLIARLCVGDFRYEDIGLLDRTHLRWFTRETIFELFEGQGYRITEGLTRTFIQPDPTILDLIVRIATHLGHNSSTIISDVTPLQYVVRAEPH